jgi:hypothetical protein
LYLFTTVLFVVVGDDDDRVDGVRLCLSTADSDGPTVYSLCGMSVENHGGMTGKTLNSSTKGLWQTYQQNHIIAKQDKRLEIY